MRGSVYYQSAQLTKIIFKEGTKKTERINPQNPHYQKISSYGTMQSYRQIWENFFNYLKEHWQIKNCELITEIHVVAYMEYKVEYYPSRQYLEKISAAMGKLETALNLYNTQFGKIKQVYDFSGRRDILNHSKELELVADNYHNRAYADPIKVIENLTHEHHRLAATIQYEGGARLEAVSLIKKEQLKGYQFDSVTKKEVGVIETKEKGGKVGDVQMSKATYHMLQNILTTQKYFKLSKNAYINDIKSSCDKASLPHEASHGFRWNFAQRRLQEYAQAGYTYEQSLQAVSWEMKHNRASITEHYLSS